MPWFEVTAEKLDWKPPNARWMMCFPQGGPYFGTRACVDKGEAVDAIKRIRKPAGYHVDKAGKVVRDA